MDPKLKKDLIKSKVIWPVTEPSVFEREMMTTIEERVLTDATDPGSIAKALTATTATTKKSHPEWVKTVWPPDVRRRNLPEEQITDKPSSDEPEVGSW